MTVPSHAPAAQLSHSARKVAYCGTGFQQLLLFPAPDVLFVSLVNSEYSPQLPGQRDARKLSIAHADAGP